ncbi:MAG TPA: hypothetical protein VKR21_12090 [Solirubrobacteraceae bacterium]|nr:hypothetical protein [Solirubrobacteraceae bacterium]
MYAVVLNVTIHDPEAATRALQSQVVPRASQARGFVTGYWLAMPDGTGTSVLIFDSQDAASAMAEHAQPPGDFITFDRLEIAEVVASA